ncbi:hypothetical protein Rsub_11356, partial [Raphidocelis subcapitata]
MSDPGPRRPATREARCAAPAAAMPPPPPLLLLLLLALVVPCRACDTGCTACDAAGCTACASGHWKTNDNRCVATCPAGSYKSSATWTWSTAACVPCMSTCATCNSGTKCTSCSGVYWLTGATMTCVTAADCPAGTFAATDRVCRACATTCATCNAGSYQNCTSCIDNKYLLSPGYCVTTCPPGTRKDEVARTCAPCPANCAACSSNTVFSTCPDGTFKNPQIWALKARCQACTLPCLTCETSADYCLTETSADYCLT